VFGLPDRDEIMRQTIILVIGFIALAVGSALVQFLASFTLSVAGERLTKRLRALSFRAMLRQEIGWFDKKANSTGALTTKLATDASEVKGVSVVTTSITQEQCTRIIPYLLTILLTRVPIFI